MNKRLTMFFYLKRHERGQSQKLCFGNLSLQKIWISNGQVSVFLISSYLLKHLGIILNCSFLGPFSLLPVLYLPHG